MNNRQSGEEFIDRTIYVFGEIDTEMAKSIISKIDLINEYDRLLEEEDTGLISSLINQGTIEAKSVNGLPMREPIYLEINSNGGETSAGYSIITAIENSGTPIIGYATGNCMSMAVAILASCHYRLASEYSEFMIHDVYTGMQGKYNDLDSMIKYVERIRSNYSKVLVKYTKLSGDKVNELVNKNADHYFSPFDAKKMGIVDNLDIDTVDEAEFLKKLYGEEEEVSSEEETEDVEEVVEKIVGEDKDTVEKEPQIDIPYENNLDMTNLEKLEEHIGFKLD